MSSHWNQRVWFRSSKLILSYEFAVTDLAFQDFWNLSLCSQDKKGKALLPLCLRLGRGFPSTLLQETVGVGSPAPAHGNSTLPPTLRTYLASARVTNVGGFFITTCITPDLPLVPCNNFFSNGSILSENHSFCKEILQANF